MIYICSKRGFLPVDNVRKATAITLMTRDTERSLGLNWVHIFVLGSIVRVDERADSLELVKRKHSG